MKRTPEQEKKIAELGQRILSAQHAGQTAVQIDLGAFADTPALIPRQHSCSPKHLRVGVNSAMVDQSALVQLLIKKGVISEEEYFESLAIAHEQEKEMQEKILSEKFGKKITLH